MAALQNWYFPPPLSIDRRCYQTIRGEKFVRDLKVPEQRHPEKAHRPDNAQPRKPDWIRVKGTDKQRVF